MGNEQIIPLSWAIDEGLKLAIISLLINLPWTPLSTRLMRHGHSLFMCIWLTPLNPITIRKIVHPIPLPSYKHVVHFVPNC